MILSSGPTRGEWSLVLEPGPPAPTACRIAVQDVLVRSGGPATKLTDEPPTPQINVIPSSGQTFVVTPNGTTYDILAGWPTRTADNQQGIVALNPDSIGVGNGKENEVRIMDPNPKNPNGYSRYTNSGGQYLNPATGKPDSNPNTHIPTRYEGVYQGWPE